MGIEQLVSLAISGDKQALTDIYNEYYNRIYYFALNRLKNEQDAEDIVQNTFIEVFKSVKTLSEPKAFKSWIYLIAERQIIALYRQRGRTPHTVDEAFEEVAEDIEDGEFLPENVLESESIRNAVMELIHSLPEAQKTAVLLYYYEEMTVKDIADVEQCSVGTVKSRLNYARNYIRSRIEEQRKKGTSLIAVAPLPLLTLLLREMAESSKMSPDTASGILSNVGNATGVIVPVEIAPTNPISGTTGAIAKTGMTAVTKAIIGTITAAVIATGVFVGVKLLENPDNYNNNVNITTPSGTTQANNPTIQASMPVTESDYAKMYYQHIQDVLIPTGRFIDADMLDFTGDGKPEMITSELWDRGTYADTCTSIYHIIDDNGAKVVSLETYTHGSDNAAISDYSSFDFIGLYEGKKSFIKYSKYTNDTETATTTEASISIIKTKNQGNKLATINDYTS